MALRREVLRKPLGLNYTPEELAAENADTLLAAFVDGHVVACLLLTPVDSHTAKMRQVAVAPERQGQGLGRRLVEFSEEWLRGRGFRHITLSARDTAIPFYLALGYACEGELFTRIGIPHRQMAKRLE